MKREEIAARIHWSAIIWIMGLVNVGAMLPQLVSIISTRNVEGLSLEMFAIYLVIQIAFALEGFFKRNRMFLVCMGLSACVSIAIISAIIVLR